MKRKLILFLFITLSNLSFSQTIKTQTIRGTIVDSESDYPLPGAAILLLTDSSTTTFATVTDINGYFTLENIPLGRQSFMCQYIGYKDQTINNYLVVMGKEGYLDIKLEQDVTSLSEVVISSRKRGEVNNTLVSVSANTLEQDEIIRFSGSLGDVSRMAQNFAGVSGASDDRNDIIVRGNSPSSVLWRLEGLDIPSPNHYASLGATGGPISMLNANNLKSSDFLSGAFPAEYANVTGAVLDLKLRNGNSNKYEFLGQIGFNGVEFGTEGPINGIGENASFLINYRYSTLQVFDILGLDLGTGGAIPQYQDINFKVNVPTKKAGTFSFWGLGGLSDISFQAAEEEGDNLFTDDETNVTSESNTGILGFNHKYFFNYKTSSMISLAFSATESINTTEEIIQPNSSTFESTFNGKMTQIKSTINWTLNSKINKKHRIKYGANYDHFNLNVKDSLLVDIDFWFNVNDFDGNASLLRAFGQWQYKLNQKLKLNTGLNVLYLSRNKSSALEPRFGLTYDVNERNIFALGYGRHNQMQPLPIYFSSQPEATDQENIQNSKLDFLKSDHFVVSYTHLFKSNIRLKLETYYQNLFSAAVDPKEGYFSVLNAGADFGFPNNVGLTNNGKGRNYGLELTLQKSLSKGFYFLLTGSLFESKYTGSDLVERNTYYNSNYVTNFLIGKEINLNNKFLFTIDAKMNYSGGRRYTPIDLPASIMTNEQVLDNTNYFGQQYKPYIRPDLKLGLKSNGEKITQTWSIDLQNFIFRDNVFIQSYDKSSQTIRTLNQRGFFPDLRYQILF